MTSRTPVLVAALVIAKNLAPAAQLPPSFRSAVDTVLLTVSVKDGGRPVLDLARRDFEVRDNNVVQALSLIHI